MKKIIVVLVMIFAVAFVESVPSRGTVRVFTGMPGWKVGHEGLWKNAPRVCQRCRLNMWDDEMDGPDGFTPLPWHKLYLSDGAYWISWDSTGKDTTNCELEPCGYTYVSPSFPIYSNVSRATMWVAVDDTLAAIKLRKNYRGVWDITGGADEYHKGLFRIDVTDVFRRACDNTARFQIEFYVWNTLADWTGIIAYISYDYYYGAEVKYDYHCNTSSSGQWRWISMPFRTVDTTQTLYSIWGGHIDSAKYYSFWNPYYYPLYPSWRYISIHDPLKGDVGDIVRSHTIGIRFAQSGVHTATVYGYPVFEQRYLDQILYRWLYISTVYGNVLFSGTNPDDYPDSMITGNATWNDTDAVGGDGTWYNPTLSASQMLGLIKAFPVTSLLIFLTTLIFVLQNCCLFRMSLKSHSISDFQKKNIQEQLLLIAPFGANALPFTRHNLSI